jgi:hypothetical protein
MEMGVMVYKTLMERPFQHQTEMLTTRIHLIVLLTLAMVEEVVFGLKLALWSI